MEVKQFTDPIRTLTSGQQVKTRLIAERSATCGQQSTTHKQVGLLATHDEQTSIEMSAAGAVVSDSCVR